MNNNMNSMKKLALNIRKFCWWSAGVVPSVLEKCPTNQGKYTAIGILMVFIGCLASISFAFFLSHTFAIPAILALFGGILWGILIFSLDRVVLTSFRKDETSKISIIQRFVLTISLSLIISEPLLLHLFRKEIALQMAQTGQIVSTDAREKATARFQTEKDSLENANREIQTRLDALKKDRDEKQAAITEEVEGKSRTGKSGYGIAAKQKEDAFNDADAKYKEYKAESAVTLANNNTRLAEIHTEIENEIKNISAANSEADGVLAKHEALFKVIKTQPGAALVYLPLFFGLLFLETLPLSIKVFGKKSVYDIALEAEESVAVTNFQAENASHQKRYEAIINRIDDSIINQTLLSDEKESKLAEKLKDQILWDIESKLSGRQINSRSEAKFGEEIAVEIIGQDDLQVKLQLPENVRHEISLQELDGDIKKIADELDEKNMKLAKAFSSKGHEIWHELPLLPQLESDQKLVLQFEPLRIN